MILNKKNDNFYIKVKLLHKKQEAIILDAIDYTYGRLCAKIANILLGKYNIYRSVHHLTGSVIIKNLESVKFSGKNKTHQIKHYKHTGYAGGLRIITLAQYMQRNRLLDYLRVSVYKMMPKTHHTKEYIYKQIKVLE